MGLLDPFIQAYISTFGPPFQPLLLLFTALSFVYVWRGIKLGGHMWRERADLVASPLTRIKRKIADDASFYVFVPLGVFIHELGHAIIVWLFGGVVLEFGFFFYWGYVLPDRMFGPETEWLLSFSGTIGNILFAIAVYVWSRNHASRWVRYLGRRVVRFQIFFAFIYYPIFTALLAFGDWRTIYDFNATPSLSGAVAVLHVSVLGLYFVLDRRGWFDTVAVSSTQEQQQYDAILARADAEPDNMEAQVQRVQVMVHGGNIKGARREAQRLVAHWPDSAETHLQHAVTLTVGQDRLPPKAAESALKALSLGLSDPAQEATAHKLAGLYYSDLGRTDDALQEYERGLESAERARRQGVQINSADFHFQRGLLLRRQGNAAAAQDAFDHAIRQAKAAGLSDAATYYEQQAGTPAR